MRVTLFALLPFFILLEVAALRELAIGIGATTEASWFIACCLTYGTFAAFFITRNPKAP